MNKALYRKYRSKRLSEVVGQTHITDILQRALKEGKIAHAYLFVGPRGVGKTSVARILAHEINGLQYSDDSSHLDIIEIDAASNNGVDDIRDLRDRVQLVPVSAARKVYIIDEVHMLSKAAFNALLKTLEEPPEHIVFILATTDADKLPATVVSRTQRFSFRAIPVNEAVKHLRFIAEQENLAVTDEALELIAEHGDGSFRDSISLIDQLRTAASAEGITRDVVESSLGLPPADTVNRLITAYEVQDLQGLVELLDSTERAGMQSSAIANQLIRTIRLRISEKPQLLPLLDKLLGVMASPRPEIKLLTVLGTFDHERVRSAALVSTPPTISASPVALKNRPIDEKPILPDAAITVKIKPLPDTAVSKPLEISTSAFDWNKIIEYMRSNHIAIYTVLSKCTHHISGDRLTIYAGNGFYKKKLDDNRYRTTLTQFLSESGIGNLSIDVIGTKQPPLDMVAAAVAAVMGGGEEFTLEEEK